MSIFFNKILEALKKNPLLRLFYKLPFAPSFYGATLAFLGAVVYGLPSAGWRGKIFVVGVTGTKGKSTVVELIGHVLKFSGKKVATLSSVGMEIAGQREDKPLDNTMPGRFFIQQFLSRAIKAGCQYAIIEVTSEGVKLNRHRFINWSAAILTNLALEHIEAHGSFEKYREAKLKFFRYAKNLFFINQDDKNAEYFIKAAKSKIYLYGKSDLSSQLVGEFNQYNIGAAVSFAQSQEIDEEIIKKAIIEFPGVPGRMEFVHLPTDGKPFTVVVDYAHTPDSLRQAYQALSSNLRSQVRRKLICVLGAAGGGRDRWKRPEMGKIAAEYCDEIILTNEDPYDENPEDIINQVAVGCSPTYNSKLTIHKIIDRKQAIKTAINSAQNGDIIIITGKGSEKWIHVEQGRKVPWSDKGVVVDLLKSQD